MSETQFGVTLPARRGFSVPIQVIEHAGITAWLVEDHSIPVVSVAWSWEGGQALLEVTGPGAARVTLERAHQLRWQGGRWWVDGDLCRERIVTHPAGVSVFGGGTVHLTPLDPLARRGADEGGDGLTRSPMPGLVRSVHVEAGQQVKAGDRLAVLEAMKMEHSLTALRDGTVAEVLARPGDQVEAGAPLIRLEATDD